MRLENLSRVWAVTPLKEVVDGEAFGGYTRLRSFYANIQYDRNETDAAVYGELTNEIMKLRVLSAPDVGKFDRLFLVEPSPVGSFVYQGETYPDYGPGAYEVTSDLPASGAAITRNPAIITAKAVH